MAKFRRPGTVSAAALVGLIACLVGAHLAAPEWSRGVGLDVWNYSALSASRHEAGDRRADLERMAERNVRRRAAADQSAARLSRGEIALADAARDLADLFHDDLGARASVESFNPGGWDTPLLFARHAIERAVRLQDDPAAGEALRARLQDELCEMVARAGGPH